MTFSIIASNKNRTEFGIAICSAIPFIGKYSAFVFPNIGVIASQGKVDPVTAYTIRSCLSDNLEASDILSYLEKKDPSFQRKQLTFLNLKNHKFYGYTGNDLKVSKIDNSEIFGDIIFGDDFVVSGNCLVSLDTLKVMKDSFIKNNTLPLDLRILEALKAGNSLTGDYRGRQSASLYYFNSNFDYPIRTIDVDEHKDPVIELERIFYYATEHWQNVVNYCFFDMNFKRKYMTGPDFPEEIAKSISKLSKPVRER